MSPRGSPDNDDHELLIRLDERMSQIQKKLDEFMISSDKDYVTKTEFQPIQRAVYSAIGFILTGVIGGLASLLLKGTGGP